MNPFTVFCCGKKKRKSGGQDSAVIPAGVAAGKDDSSFPLPTLKKVGEGEGEGEGEDGVDSAFTCPICSEVPRTGPLFSCSNGHLMCKLCGPKLSKCGLCHCSDIGRRNYFAERLLKQAMEIKILKCLNSHHGCEVVESLSQIIKHEAVCRYRQVPCASAYRGACLKVVPLSELFKHVIETKCALFLKNRADDDRPYVSVIGDFSNTEMTIWGGRNKPTYWLPVMLVQRKYIRYFPHICISRDGLGNWRFCVRSYLDDEEAPSVEIVVRRVKPTPIAPLDLVSASGVAHGTTQAEIARSGESNVVNAKGETKEKEEEEADKIFVFKGRMVSVSLTEGELIASGQFLAMKDENILPLGLGRTLLEYAVSFKANK